MGRERQVRRSRRIEPPVRVVPSKRGLVFAFTVTCAWAAALGLFAERCCTGSRAVTSSPASRDAR